LNLFVTQELTQSTLQEQNTKQTSTKQYSEAGIREVITVFAEQ